MMLSLTLAEAWELINCRGVQAATWQPVQTYRYMDLIGKKNVIQFMTLLAVSEGEEDPPRIFSDADAHYAHTSTSTLPSR